MLEKIKQLRDRTGAGISDCKAALDKNNGDLDKAILYMREIGILKAAAKSHRVTSKGMTYSLATQDGSKGSLLQINCETDFVSKGKNFQDLVVKLSNLILETGNLPKDTIQEELNKLILSVGENIVVKEWFFFNKGTVAAYNHSNTLSSLVSVRNASQEIANLIAVQVAAMKPKYISQIPQEVINEERHICQVQHSGKPQEIFEKNIFR